MWSHFLIVITSKTILIRCGRAPTKGQIDSFDNHLYRIKYMKQCNWGQIICIKNCYLKLELFTKVYHYLLETILLKRKKIDCWVLWHINHCRLFNAKSSLYIYIKYIWFGWVGFYGISTIVGYLMPNPLYTYILNTYDLVGLGFMAFQPL